MLGSPGACVRCLGIGDEPFFRKCTQTEFPNGQRQRHQYTLLCTLFGLYKKKKLIQSGFPDGQRHHHQTKARDGAWQAVADSWQEVWSSAQANFPHPINRMYFFLKRSLTAMYTIGLTQADICNETQQNDQSCACTL